MYAFAQEVRDRGWIFHSSEKEATVKPLCQRVEKEFELPTTRLCRYFADSDDEFLIANPRFGPHFRGFYATVAARNCFPKYLFDCFFHPLQMFSMRETSPSFDEMVAFDGLI